MAKHLQSSTLYFHNVGEKVYIDGYYCPFRIVGITKDQVTLRHIITKCKIFLSPGWPCRYEIKPLSASDKIFIDPVGNLQRQGLL